MLNISEKILSKLKDIYGLVEKKELIEVQETVWNKLAEIRNLKGEIFRLSVVEDDFEALVEKLKSLGIDINDLSKSAVRKAVYEETPTTTKLKKLEVDYKGEITEDAAVKAIKEGNFITAAYIARKLEESNGIRKKDGSSKKTKGDRPNKKVAVPNQ